MSLTGRFVPLLLATGAATLLVAGAPARAETFDLYIHSYCPPAPAYCGVPGIKSDQEYRRYLEDVVEEINRQWEVNGISFRPQVQGIEDNPIAARALCRDDPATPTVDETALFNAWRANIAATHPKAISVILQNWNSDGLCCSQLPINNDPDPEEIFGIRCNARSRYGLGSVLAHELGHHFCLCHAHGWNASTNSFGDTQNWSTTNDGPLDWDGDNNAFCAVTDTSADPGTQEFWTDPWGVLLNPQPAGSDLDPFGAPVNGHEWCANAVIKDPAAIDDWSPHQSFCATTCQQRVNGQTQSFLVGLTETTARNAMSYHDDRCRGPFVTGGVRKESFTPVQKQRIDFCRQTYRGAGTANPLVDVCAAAGGDFDKDGICQDDDNCAFVKNTSQRNQDSDAAGDACDPAPALPYEMAAIANMDDDGDGCPDIVDQHPLSSQQVVGSHYATPCGKGKVASLGFEGVDSDGDGLLNCEDRDDDNDLTCDEGGPLPGGSQGVPPGGCVAGPGGVDDCPTTGAGPGCHLSGVALPCLADWIVCLGAGCGDFFLKITLVGDPDPLRGAVFESFQIAGNNLYLPRLPEKTLAETAAVIQGSFVAAGRTGAAGASAGAYTPAADPLLRMEIWSWREMRPVAVVAEYTTGNATFDLADRGAHLEATPGADDAGNSTLIMRGTFAPGLPAAGPAPRDTDADGWPDWMDNCVVDPNRAQTDADGDKFGNVCDADLDGDREVTDGDVAAVEGCSGADLGLQYPIAEPAWLQGMDAMQPPDPGLLALADRCRGADLDDSGLVDAVDARIASSRVGQAPGPSAYGSSGTLCTGPAGCDDLNACTEDTCIPETGACVHRPACWDGDHCTADFCDAATGACTHRPLSCDDLNVCTLDVCRPSDGTCINDPVPTPAACDDLNPCTSGDSCADGVCAGVSAIDCSDRDACTIDWCDPDNALCVHRPGGCDDGNPCTADSCDGLGGCLHASFADGTACEDGDLCTLGDACRIGSCVPGASLQCDDRSPCTYDFCDPAVGGCQFFPIACDDGILDTIDYCDQVVGCLSQPIVPDEVFPVRFTDILTIGWGSSYGAIHWNTYRGSIPPGMLGSRPAASRYDDLCFESADLGGNGPMRSVDGSAPPRDTAWYYLITGENGAAEGPAAVDAFGGMRYPPNPCVTPP
jgi:hypothetical protein